MKTITFKNIHFKYINIISERIKDKYKKYNTDF